MSQSGMAPQHGTGMTILTPSAFLLLEAVL